MSEHEVTTQRTDELSVDDPGIEPHLPRTTDIDDDSAKRSEKLIAGLFLLAAVLAIAFIVCYFAIDKHAILHFGPLHTNALNLALGATMGGSLALIGIAAIAWARRLMGDHEIVEERHPAGSTEADRRALRTEFEKGVTESGFGRRKLIRGSLLTAMGVLALPPLVLLRDLGPLPGRRLYHTIWADGIRIVGDGTGRPIKPSDVVVGQLVNGEPENLAHIKEESHEQYLIDKGKAAVILVRIDPSEVKTKPGRENWSVDGILCYSKICSHVGCPISLYEQQTYHVLCPCHQSTFDLADSAKVVFGPAGRPLPQLPIKVNEDGYLVARSDFHEPVGASFWERD